MEIVRMYGPLVGRVLLALIFIISGFGKLTGFAGTVGYIQSAGLPVPQLVAVIAIIVELGGGIMLVIGWKARWAALALFIFSGLTIYYFHDFWTMDGADRLLNQTMALKHLSIMGGVLLVAAVGSGPVALERPRLSQA